MELSAEFVEVAVTIDGQQYVLKEASEGASIVYRDAHVKAARIKEVDGGTRESSFGNLADSDALLVSMCLFKVGAGKDGGSLAPVDVRTVKSWPTRVVKQLYKKVREISDMQELDSEEALQKQVDYYTRMLERKRAERPKGGSEAESSPDASR